MGDRLASKEAVQQMTDRLPHPPIARRVPHAFTCHGITVEDPYAWLRDPGYPEVKDADILEESTVNDPPLCSTRSLTTARPTPKPAARAGAER